MLHLDLQPETEAQLAAEAEATGLPIERYLETILAQRTPPAPVSAARKVQISDAIDRIRELRVGNFLGDLSVKDLINEGRKY